nr:cobalt transporter CbiM [Desulfobulbaceae bacterium]
MHVSDGVLSPSIIIGSYLVTLGLSAWSSKKVASAELPKVAVVTSSFFVASLIHIPLGPTSVHLLLPGIVGVLLGSVSFVSIFVGLILQCILFQFGGVTSLGANALMMGIPAIICGVLFQRFRGTTQRSICIAGGVFATLGTVFSAVLLAGLLATAGEDFFAVAKFSLLAHIPVFIVEGVISAFTISFLYRVKPELLLRAKP